MFSLNLNRFSLNLNEHNVCFFLTLGSSQKNRGELDEAYQRVLDLMQLVEGADDKEGESVHAEAFAEP